MSTMYQVSSVDDEIDRGFASVNPFSKLLEPKFWIDSVADWLEGPMRIAELQKIRALRQGIMLLARILDGFDLMKAQIQSVRTLHYA